MTGATTLVMTVLDEVASMPRVLESIERQTLQPDEVVVVDGGSTDGTIEVLRAWAERDPDRHVVLVRPGANISAGRNIAFGRARGRLVAVTDAGTTLDERWFEHLVTTARGTGADVVAGFFVPSGDTFFERVLSAVVTPRLDEVTPQRFLPSSRSVLMTREVWAAAGGYPEWLDYCEDLLLDMRIVAMGGRIEFCPEAVVTWSARPTLSAYYRQYYRYARGDGKAGIKARTHAARYGAYLIGLVGVAVALEQHWVWWLLGVLALGYLVPPTRRLLRAGVVTRGALVRGVALVPVISIVGDVARMCGFPVGVVWRRRRRRAAGYADVRLTTEGLVPTGSSPDAGAGGTN